MTAPTSREGVGRFLTDYRTRYRIHVQSKGVWEAHPTEPAFDSMTAAELRAARIAGPTRVDMERSGNLGSIEGGTKGKPLGETVGPSDLDCRDTAAPPRCQKCGIYKDAEPQPFDDPNSICYKIVSDYPEPNGDHEWPKPAPEDRDECEMCGACDAPKDEDGNFCYPKYLSNQQIAGVCGWCARERVSR